MNKVMNNQLTSFYQAYFCYICQKPADRNNFVKFFAFRGLLHCDDETCISTTKKILIDYIERQNQIPTWWFLELTCQPLIDCLRSPDEEQKEYQDYNLISFYRDSKKTVWKGYCSPDALWIYFKEIDDIGITLVFDSYNADFINTTKKVQRCVSLSNILYHNNDFFEYFSNPKTNLVGSSKITITYDELPSNVLELIHHSKRIAKKVKCSQTFHF
jgi:hypothetical protein